MALHREYPELKTLRDAIDAIDRQIADLLVERIGLVLQVGELKRAHKEQKSFIRPDREAIMIRDLAARFRDTSFPPSAATAIWRIIIGASTATESPLKLAIADAREAGGALALAREYFGPSLGCTRHEMAELVLAQIAEDAHAIGIFPLEYLTGEQQPWWWQMTHGMEDCRIFARLPFVTTRQEPATSPVFVAGCVEPAPSGRDLTLFAIDADLSASRLQGIDVLQTALCGDRNCSLIEAHGWLAPGTPGHEALHQMLESSLPTATFTLHYLGAYAQPFTVER